MKKFILSLILAFCTIQNSNASQLLIPMDNSQSNHLKAYGVAFYLLENDVVIEWLLNYRDGSFLVPHLVSIEEELLLRGVHYEVIADVQAQQIKTEISNPEINQEVIQLEKAPKIAVYTPPGTRPWDDAVTMVLEYAEIP